MTVRAAGGLVTRELPGGSVEVLIVHRPRYDDWSIPKGKCTDGEEDEECALREVEEETGLRCELVRELASSFYRDAHGRPKQVRYWLMQPLSGSFVPQREVDEITWLPPEEAEQVLTYDRDRLVLASLLDAHPESRERD